MSHQVDLLSGKSHLLNPEPESKCDFPGFAPKTSWENNEIIPDKAVASDDAILNGFFVYKLLNFENLTEDFYKMRGNVYCYSIHSILIDESFIRKMRIGQCVTILQQGTLNHNCGISIDNGIYAPKHTYPGLKNLEGREISVFKDFDNSAICLVSEILLFND